jgi:glycosyltransferase involved in cell wall biosynthesis
MLKRELEKNATQTVEKYSWQAISQRLAQLYEDIQ